MLGLLRDYTPESICFTAVAVTNKNYYDASKFTHYPAAFANSNFAQYLTGLVEGGGCIVVPTRERSDKGRLNYPAVQISFHGKEFPLAQAVQRALNTGSIARKAKANAYVLTINDFAGLFLVISLLNGNMRTPKIGELHRLIDWVNNRFPELHFSKRQHDCSSVLDSAWLSGFIEADGHFSLRYTEQAKYPLRVECKFELTQAQKNGNCELFMGTVAPAFMTQLKSIREDREHPQYRLRTHSLTSNRIVISYLSKFPLFSSKFLDFQD